MVRRLEFVLNARVNCVPELLEQAVLFALEGAKPDAGSRFILSDFACFEPAPPRPVYRMA
jgi:hypothetical protein